MTVFPINIVDEAGGTRSAPLPVQLVWGKCVPPPSPIIFYATTGTSGPPASNPPNPPQGDCPGGAVAKEFMVCERCGTSGLATEKTFWGCSLPDAITKMGNPGCASTLRTSVRQTASSSNDLGIDAPIRRHIGIKAVTGCDSRAQ